MKTKIPDVKNRYAFLLLLALGLMAARPAMAACNVTLSAILPGNQAVLKADCGTASMTEITWFSNGQALPGFPFVFAATQADLTFTATLTGGNQSYTASGRENGDGTTAGTGTMVTAGKAAVISLANVILTVASSTGGTVTSNTGGISCGSACTATYASGAPVTLTAAPDGSHSFSGWGGDCSGTSTSCVVSMTTSRTVTAAFGAQPVAGVCANPGASSTPPTNLCTTGTPSAVSTGTDTYSWTCAGPNNGGTASCSVPRMVAGVCGSASGSTPLSAAPSGTAACAAGTFASLVPGSTAFTWSCNGINGGANATACSAPVAATNGACGSANNSNVASAPTGTAACSAGALGTMTNPSNTFSWTCNGLAGGNPQTCTAYQIVNGACGSANGTSVSSAPTGAAACSVGSQANLSGSGPWSWSCTGINTGQSASCSATLSVASAACAAPAGWTCNINPVANVSSNISQFNTPMNINQSAVWIFSVSPNVVNAHSFTIVPGTFPANGVQIMTNQYISNVYARNMFISDAPGSTREVGFGCTRQGIEGAYIFVTTSASAYGMCVLQPNRTYWLNIMATTPNVPMNYLVSPQPM